MQKLGERMLIANIPTNVPQVCGSMALRQSETGDRTAPRLGLKNAPPLRGLKQC
jgi:hypothetical protein